MSPSPNWHSLSRPALPVVVVGVLLCLGLANMATKASWRPYDDGAFWAAGPSGVTAHALAPDGSADAAGVKPLDGTCYVVTPAATRPRAAHGFWMRRIIAPSLGALHQSQFYLELNHGQSPVLSAGDANVILFIAAGTGAVQIGGRRFGVTAGDGVHVRRGETFRISAEQPLRAFVSALPGIDALDQPGSQSQAFDEAWPERVRGIDVEQRSQMGPRYFQMLVDTSIGSTDAAQFIGHIPRSRGEMHRHLYEEALIILSGDGMMWTEESCASVTAGDVIFLPRKQAHSLECTCPEGMDVVGVIHPGDNPGINY